MRGPLYEYTAWHLAGARRPKLTDQISLELQFRVQSILPLPLPPATAGTSQIPPDIHVRDLLDIRRAAGRRGVAPEADAPIFS